MFKQNCHVSEQNALRDLKLSSKVLHRILSEITRITKVHPESKLMVQTHEMKKLLLYRLLKTKPERTYVHPRKTSRMSPIPVMM